MRGRLRKLLFSLRAWRQTVRAGVALGQGVRLQKALQMKATDGGRISLGGDVRVGRNSDLLAKFGTLQIGPRCHIGAGAVFVARDRIVVGADCLIAEYVVLRDQNHRIAPGQLTRETGFDTAPIEIGENVWIGTKATILAGVTIGRNSVVAAHAVVTRDVPENTVVAGVPARIVRTTDSA